MAYQTGAASTAADLLNQLATFAAGVGLGWVVLRNALGTYRNIVLQHATATDVVFDLQGLAAGASGISVSGATGWSSGAAYGAQPGAGTSISIDALSVPWTAYHFFGTSEYLHVAIEYAAGLYRHLHIGRADKRGIVYTGGAYYGVVDWTSVSPSDDAYSSFGTTSLHNNYQKGNTSRLRVDIDGGVSRWVPFESGPGYPRIRCNQRWLGSQACVMFSRSPNQMSGRAVLGQLEFQCERPGGLYSPVGVAPDLRLVNLANYAPGDSITLGTDTWRVFPQVKREASASLSVYAGTSRLLGYAYRVVS